MTASFEAKLHGFRRTQDGVVISYVIHPNDLSSEMALAPLGTRYMVAFAEIGDDDKQSSEKTSCAQREPHSSGKQQRDTLGVTAGETAPNKDRKPFASLPLSQQAAIRSTDKAFQAWIGVSSDAAAADYIREHCKVTSRAHISADDGTGLRWAELERQFKAHLTDAQYAGALR